MKTIKEIMTSPAQAVEKNETIRSAANLMYKSNIGFLPVVDKDNKVVGTITDRDITMAIGRTNTPVHELKIHEIMNKKVHTVDSKDDAAMALKIMRTKQVGRLPVVDTENRLKGVISLMGIAHRIKNNSQKNELEHSGEENIINTLHSLAERSQKLQSIEESAEE
jgi:predicted transcriptional regulator